MLSLSGPSFCYSLDGALVVFPDVKNNHSNNASAKYLSNRVCDFSFVRYLTYLRVNLCCFVTDIIT